MSDVHLVSFLGSFEGCQKEFKGIKREKLVEGWVGNITYILVTTLIIVIKYIIILYMLVFFEYSNPKPNYLGYSNAEYLF